MEYKSLSNISRITAFCCRWSFAFTELMSWEPMVYSRTFDAYRCHRLRVLRSSPPPHSGEPRRGSARGRWWRSWLTHPHPAVWLPPPMIKCGHQNKDNQKCWCFCYFKLVYNKFQCFVLELFFIYFWIRVKILQ